ncbi:ABC1 kinase family protein [Microbacterium sp. ASV49]|uniref:AarF/UbiB family protein n=1 Tax=Microbacterium candidum TaxID=3041922 RepID=A0ABT7MTP8_9MICO|nr:AarF/UbiB family protein [Microbacterium sp. ASV49]MDL9977826.1 AarF/UbiB family protein [Microbacterium sp. ASV49]
MQIIGEVMLIALATIVIVLLIGAFARRVLGVRIGAIRIILAGVLALGAEVGFESQAVWGSRTYNPALLLVQFGVVLFVATTFLVVAELLVPQGSVPGPGHIVRAARSTSARARRYSELVRIATRHKLVPFKLNTEQTSAGAAERTRQAVALRAALEDAGGAFIKLGQLLSTRTDVLPVEFTTALASLQQTVPPVPWAEIAPTLEAELGAPVSAVFATIDPVPVAAASIGQVHAAELPTGERVAVKVQRPGIVPLVERDVDITRRVAKRLGETATWARRFGIEDLAESLTDNLLDEIDYRIEATNVAALAVIQERYPAARRVRIPRLHRSLSSRRVLVMEFVEGCTLSDPAAVSALTDEVRAGLAARLFDTTLTQIIDDGVFHSDLHPGNVMVTPDAELALLDFGSVGRLDSEVRAQVADLLLAFSRSDSVAFADALIAFVDLPDDVDEFALRRQIGDFLSRRLGPGAALDASAFAEVMAVLSAHGLSAPPQLTVAFRAVATVEGTLRVLSPDFDLVDAASDYAKERVTRAQRPSAIIRTAADELTALIPLARRLPHRIDRITGSLADGRLAVNVRLLADKRDRALVREFLNLAAITFLAGVFGIMAAMLLTSTVGPRINDTLTLYQLFGYLLVVVSGVLTLRVVFDVFRRRQRRD